MAKMKNIESNASGAIVYRWMPNPFSFKQSADMEMMLQTRKQGSPDPGRGPHRDPAESYVLLATVIGILVCCTVGALVGAWISGFGGIFLGLIAGLLVGGLGGSWIGELLKERHIRNRGRRSVDRKSKSDEQGPFIK